MEIVKRENIEIQNSVIVSGLTLSALDEELEDYLKRYGSVKRSLLIDNPESEYHHNTIVEFDCDTAMSNLEPSLPMDIQSTQDSNSVFHVRSLGSVYASAASSSLTEGYLESLVAIAQASGKPLQDVLQMELQKMNALKLPASDSPRPDTPVQMIPEPENPVKESTPDKSPYYSISNNASTADTISLNLPTSALNPPGIQRVVLEHVVKTSDAVSSSNAAYRLKAFSGRSPRQNTEPDFETWRASIDFLINDQSLSDSHKTRKILDSLLPPASDVVRHVGPDVSPTKCLELLESVYGSVEDADELLVKFISTLQNQGEKPSAYLHRLHVMLSATIRRGGVTEAERKGYLLKQFCRGCWDNNLISDLQLERRKAAPPSFAELIVLIRTAEDKLLLKEERMKKHLGINKHVSVPVKFRTATHQQSVYYADAIDEPRVENNHESLRQKSAKPKSKSDQSELDALKKEVAKLQAKISSMMADPIRENKKKASSDANEFNQLKKQVAELQAHLVPVVQGRCFEKSPASKNFPVRHRPNVMGPEMHKEERPTWNSTNRPRPGYCFQCGEDGHLAVHCKNAPNPQRVEEKRRELRDRQAAWDLQNSLN
nr:uncharacterized protein LOC110438084 [Danio rerio]|eukprot:XP_021323438.1 uncharacterized protein LOC110438084 [Danio rerio]